MLAIFLLLPLFRVLPGFRSRGTVQTFPTICFLEDSVRAVQIQPFDGIPMQVTMNYLVSGCWQSQPVSEHSPLAEAKKDVLAILQDPAGIQVRNSNADTFRYWVIPVRKIDPSPAAISSNIRTRSLIGGVSLGGPWRSSRVVPSSPSAVTFLSKGS